MLLFFFKLIKIFGFKIFHKIPFSDLSPFNTVFPSSNAELEGVAVELIAFKIHNGTNII